MTREEELIAMLKTLKEQALKSCRDTTILDVKIDSFIFVIDMAIKALEQQPCDSCISRQAVLDYIYNDLGLGDEECGNDVERQMELESSYKYIKALPSVMPQPKTGHWIEKEDYNLDIYYDCSECGEAFCLIDGTPADNLYNFCPNCGARMTESEG